MMFDWLNKKRRFLSEYFVNKNVDLELLKFSSVQESDTINQNNNFDISTSWAKLLEASKGLSTSIFITSSDKNRFGLNIEDKFCKNIFEVAIQKILPQLAFETEIEDESEIISKIVDYITTNNLHKKNFYNLIKKLKNLNAGLLLED